ncbi:50S ribosomal protein L31 [bacterium (Candidatus Torokbacteria) CG_4_10_14_0_2_um_filter_35_8]|nr:MAG: 50S ribosomal protein L31 [bacterium (Candidatus Torokbacteria) CG_4_10_14_0_2_um_filter_35_8]
MKKDIHPKYYKNATIKCTCGNVIKVGATRQNMTTEICSACHPLYTGQKKVVDTAGRVERFEEILKKSKALGVGKSGKKKKGKGMVKGGKKGRMKKDKSKKEKVGKISKNKK